MFSDSGATVSSWMPRVQMPGTAPLGHDVEADVCVVGAGMAGISTAYALSSEGKKVVVLDDGEIGSGETGRTTAHLASALDDGFSRLIGLFGQAEARLAYLSHAAAIDRIEKNVTLEDLDCDFTRLNGYLFEPPGGDVGHLHKELEAARKVGVAGVHMVGNAPLPFDTGPALLFPNQGQFHPLKYLAGLARAILSHGSRIYTQTRAVEIKGGADAHVMTAGGQRISARHIVVATNTPVNDMVVMHTKQAAYRTYAIAFRIAAGEIPLGLFWDNADPYHYLRLQQYGAFNDEQLLIVGGADHKTGQGPGPEVALRHLEDWTRHCIPVAGDMVHSWSGQVMEPVDSLAFIGRNPSDEDNVYIITGDSGHGLTHSAIAAMLIPDLIMKRSNAWEAIYDPRRRSVRAATEFAEENINVAAQYRDWVTWGDAIGLDQIQPGTGAVIRSGMNKLAAFRDQAGELHTFSAVCPHLQCIVRWNALEKSFDCPCHGSRFAGDGHALNGPAIGGLTPVPPPVS